MTDNRRPTVPPAGLGRIQPGRDSVNTLADKLTCGGCAHFLVLACPPDPPLYFCHSEETKNMTPPIGWLAGQESCACKCFLPLGEVRSGRPTSKTMSLQERFLVEPEEFIDVKTAAYLLRKQKTAVYNLVEAGELESVRVAGTIFIFRPSLIALIRPNQAA